MIAIVGAVLPLVGTIVLPAGVGLVLLASFAATAILAQLVVGLASIVGVVVPTRLLLLLHELLLQPELGH